MFDHEKSLEFLSALSGLQESLAPHRFRLGWKFLPVENLPGPPILRRFRDSTVVLPYAVRQI